MTANTIPILPDSAPFSTEQRSWLNGFFAGLLGGMNGAPVNGNGHGVEGGAKPQALVVEQEDIFPWHDAAMAMDERMKLADGKPASRKLMAAMAQLDCGACGYLCKTYAEAIASGAEKDLTLCQPGGKATAVKLRELVKANPVGATTQVVASAKPQAAVERASGYAKDNPFPAPLIACSPLNKPGSAKDTRFVSVDITGSGMTYRAGDSLGVWPENCFEHVDAILRVLGLSGAEPIAIHDGRSMLLRQAMVSEYDIATPSPELLELLAHAATDANDAAGLRDLLDDKPVEGLIDQPHIIDILARFPSARLSAPDLVRGLKRMRPRLYSISSSPKAYPNEVHLTVGVVRYDLSGRRRKGVASTFLADRVLAKQPVRVFVNPSHGFAPPEDPTVPMIMVGPGTGIAPFRAFLQDRKATAAAGGNWLFFGDQRQASDFLYQDELDQYLQGGLLTRLDTAFSRDSDAKVYVQHRMTEHAAELWKWLEGGAHVYVCGDAKRMAADVDRALHQVIETAGGHSAEDAKNYVAAMSKANRYQRDVY